MPERQDVALKVHDRLTDREGKPWVVLNVHPPAGRRGALYTVLDVEGEFAYQFDITDFTELGLTIAD